MWRHASITKKRRIAIYKACVFQKLLYCLDTSWLTAAAGRKLDGFHARCLRKICKVEHSYVSRLSYAEVLAEAGEQPLTATLRYRQLKIFGRITLMPDEALMLVGGYTTPHSPPLQRSVIGSAWLRQIHCKMGWRVEWLVVMLHARVADVQKKRGSGKELLRAAACSAEAVEPQTQTNSKGMPPATVNSKPSVGQPPG